MIRVTGGLLIRKSVNPGLPLCWWKNLLDLVRRILQKNAFVKNLMTLFFCHPNERSYNSSCFCMQCIIVQKHKRRIRGGPMLQAINNLCLQDVRSTKPIWTPGNLRIFCLYESFHVIFPAALPPRSKVPTKMNRATNKRYACVLVVPWDKPKESSILSCTSFQIPIHLGMHAKSIVLVFWSYWWLTQQCIQR